MCLFRSSPKEPRRNKAITRWTHTTEPLFKYTPFRTYIVPVLQCTCLFSTLHHLWIQIMFYLQDPSLNSAEWIARQINCPADTGPYRNTDSTEAQWHRSSHLTELLWCCDVICGVGHVLWPLGSVCGDRPPSVTEPHRRGIILLMLSLWKLWTQNSLLVRSVIFSAKLWVILSPEALFAGY